MQSIGVTLRSERLRRGLTLEQVAAETKIRLHLLEAIEDDHFERLPGGLLTRSFLRQYAHTLRLDEDEIVASFKQQFDQIVDPLPAPPPQESSWHLSQPPELLWVLAVVFACAGAYSLWQSMQRKSHEVIVSAAVSRPSSKPSAYTPLPDQPPKPEPPPEAVSDVKTTAALPTPVEPGDPDLVQANGAQAMHVAFTATEPVWLSIKSDGAQTYRGTLEGQQEFAASNKMTVLVGNAGGLGVILNGKPVGPIGGHGEVRLLLLTPKGAIVVPRTLDTPVE
jgi:cytoskeletal protein RodZ